MSVEVFDVEKSTFFEEKIPSEEILRFLYSDSSYSSKFLKNGLSRIKIASILFGKIAKMGWTKKYIDPFIKDHNIKMDDFENKSYLSFNDFFMRRIDPLKRALSEDGVISPCDARTLFYQDLSLIPSFYVKGQTLSLTALLKNPVLSDLFADGSMMISRLAPVDYHGFHFPTDVEFISSTLINGPLFSVNPIALRHNVDLLTENKRLLISLKSKVLGNIVQVVIGATTVGTIHIEKEVGKFYKKGEVLGFFSFGGSMVITLFEKNRVTFNKRWVELTNDNKEVLIKMGSSILHHD